LPTIPVPLLRGDPDVPLDLGTAVRQIYDLSSYQMSIDYREPPPAPLSNEDAAWLDAYLREKGLR